MAYYDSDSDHDYYPLDQQEENYPIYIETHLTKEELDERQDLIIEKTSKSKMVFWKAPKPIKPVEQILKKEEKVSSAEVIICCNSASVNKREFKSFMKAVHIVPVSVP